MRLEAEYKNPQIILTVTASSRHLTAVKSVKCLALVLVSYHFAVLEFQESLLMSGSTLLLMIALVMMVFVRPKVVMDNVSKKMEIFGGRATGGRVDLAPHEVRRVTVQSRKVRIAMGGDHLRYYPRLLVQQRKGKKIKNMTVDCFEMESAQEACYMAMLIAAFAHASAYDSNGQICSPLRSPIPYEVSQKSAERHVLGSGLTANCLNRR
jgi:hypothetical protein